MLLPNNAPTTAKRSKKAIASLVRMDATRARAAVEM